MTELLEVTWWLEIFPGRAETRLVQLREPNQPWTSLFQGEACLRLSSLELETASVMETCEGQAQAKGSVRLEIVLAEPASLL